MTFGFENRTEKDLETVFLLIKKEYQADGPVPVDRLMQSEFISDVQSPLEFLQIIFWLAEDLKVHFFIKDRTSSPNQTKQLLIENPETPVFVVTNRTADLEPFEQAKKTAGFFIPVLPEGVDQYTFSRIFIHELKMWQDRLKSYALKAMQSHFPGSKKIKNSIILLTKILEKQDSFSFILSCSKYKSKIAKLAETCDVLKKFYTQKLSFWQKFIEQMKAFESNLMEFGKNKQIFSAHQRLSEILKSSNPFPLVDEAEQLLPDVYLFHQQVEREKVETLRSVALERLEKMIRKLISLFETFESDQEYRNQCLQNLRSLGKRIENSHSIEEMNTLIDDAKDMFVDVIEDI